MLFSVVVPVYNRPKEIRELLESLLNQQCRPFEVIIVEDGSSITCESILTSYQDQLNIQYYFETNQGQGFARNFGMERAEGDYLILFDSDCIIPSHFFKVLEKAVRERGLDAHGGPDAAAENFSVFQKALNFSMTSLWTTGGIRGKLKDPSKYQARGYNMGLSKEVFKATSGFVDPNQGEDIELSIRIKGLGYKLELVEEAFVYHKRKNTLYSFLAQSFSFGRNRINVSRYHRHSIKLVHFFPLLFLLGWIAWLVAFPYFPLLAWWGAWLYGGWTLGVLITASIQTQSIKGGLLSVLTSYGQLFSYGAGFFWESIVKAIKG